MKVRNGFVSNSSSSNFIVSTDNYESVFDLAIAMFKIRHEQGLWEDIEAEKIHRAIRDGRDPNFPISFSTCNYNTFIMRVLGCYIVTTCNNHPFRRKLDGIIIFPPPEIIKWLNHNDYLEPESEKYSFDERINSYAFQKGEVFWSPEYDIEVSRYDYMIDYKKGNRDVKPFCSDKGHFADKMVLASTREVICPYCYNKKRKEDPIKDRFSILDIRKKDED